MKLIFKKFEEMVISYAQMLIRFRWIVLVSTVTITFFLAVGGKNLSFSTNYRAFFSKDNPQLTTFEKLQNVYTKNDNILFVIAPKDGNAFSASTLDAVEDLTQQSWKIPFTIRVESVSNFQHSRADEDDLYVEDLVTGARKMTPAELSQVKSIALKEPLLNNVLVTQRSDVTGVNVTLQLPEKSIKEVPTAVAYARELADKMERKYPDLKLYLTGMVMLNNAFAESGQGDMMKLVPMMYVVMFTLMIFMLRSLTGTLATVSIIGLSTIAAMGIAGWMGIKLTPPSAQAPTMIMTLAIADSIHLLMTFFTKMRSGLKKNDAIVESMRVNFQPVFITSLTTAIGFLSMNFSDTPPLRDLGNITTIGVASAFIYSVTFLPALMAIVPFRIPVAVNDHSDWFAKFGEFVARRYRPLLISSIAVTILLGAFLTRNELNDQFVSYFDHSMTFRRDTDFAVENLSGIYRIEHSLGAEDSGGISDPVYLAKLEEFTGWYKQQPGVVHVNTITDIMKRLNKNMHGDLASHYRLPEQRDLSAQYLLLYEMSLPYGLDLNNQINVDKSATRLVVTLKNISSKEIRDLTERAEDWLRQNAPSSMFSHGSGPAVMFSYISKRNINSMLIGTTIALILISLSMIFALRSFKFGFLSLIPNLVPAITAFGIWGIVDGQVNMGLSIVAGMTLGIVVDDSVHFLTKFLRARREEGLNSQGAVKYAFQSVGRALVATSVILVGGFLVLSQSSFAMNSGMGKLTAITIALALIADFILLPSLLIWVEECKKEDIIEKEIDKDEDKDTVYATN